MPAPRLSYQYLPLHLKPCFRFCSIFPQDYEFDKKKLVYMWMALGLLHKSKTGTARPEDIGDEYFDDLVAKSFFDHSYGYYVMHDLLHELATSVSNGECFRIGDSSEPIHIPKSVRHLSIDTSDSLPIPEIEKLKYLRTLLLLEETNPSYCHIPKVLKGLRSLRILESFYFQITDDCFSNLKHLCYLCNDSDYVPKSVNKLYHLRFLDYSDYSVELPTPDYISNLINLRRLRTSNSEDGIVYGLGRLTSLQILKELDVGEGNNVNKIVELKNLRELRKLCIRNLEDATRIEEVVEANLEAKENLAKLKLKWDAREHGSPEVDERVLDALSKIVSITLVDCKGLVDLSSLGQLSHLESLNLDSMDSVKLVGGEPADMGTENRVFPLLQKLHIERLPALVEFCGGASWTTQWLPCLEELSIIGCPNLRVFSNLPCGLRKLEISKVRWVALPELWVQSGNNDGLSMLPSLSSYLYSLRIESCPCFTSLAEGLLMRSELFTSLKNLVISECGELTRLPIGGFSKFTSLKEVNIQDCPKLRRCSTSGRFLPSSLQALVVKRCDALDPLPRSPGDLNFLSQMTLVGCASITSLPSAQVLGRWKALKELYIRNCSELESLGGLQALSSLKYLTVNNCPKLVATASSLSQSTSSSSSSSSSQQLPLADLQSLCCLQSLEVRGCRNLQSLPDLPSSLNNLCLIDCSPELEERCLKDSGPDWPKIQHIPHVRIGQFGTRFRIN